MKPIALSIIAVFISLLSFGQNESGTIPSPDQKPISKAFISADRAELASAEKENFYNDLNMAAYRGEYRGEGQCAHAKSMKAGGIIAAAIGGGLFFSGIAMVAVGSTQGGGGYYDRNGYYVSTYSPLYNAGGAFIGLGTVGIAVGVPIAVIGARRVRHFCGVYHRDERSYMQLNTTGNGLALNF